VLHFSRLDLICLSSFCTAPPRTEVYPLSLHDALPISRVLGIPVRRVFAVAWGVSATLGAVAGMLLAPATLLSPFMMFDPFLKGRSEEHTSELQSRENLVCRLLLEKKKKVMSRSKVNR